MPSDDSNRSTFAVEFRHARNVRGLSGRQLAELTGVSQAKISRIENGKALPSPDEIRSLLEHLRADLDTERRLSRSLRKTSLVEPFSMPESGWLATRDSIARASNYIALCTRSVPAIVQIPEYTRALFEMNLPKEEQAVALRTRVEWQAGIPFAKTRYRVVVTMHALRRAMVSREIYRKQIERLLSPLPSNVELRLIDDDVDTYSEDTFYVLDNRVACIELGHARVLQLGNRPDVKSMQQIFESFWQRAVPFESAHETLKSLLPADETAIDLTCSTSS
jgi:transcriptional regulator with XRE-family HTH domain